MKHTTSDNTAKRWFVGLSLSAQDTLAIAQWRARALGHSRADVKPHNFHVTTAFLGHVDTTRIEMLCEGLAKVAWTGFSATFDHVGFWGKPQIHFLGCSHVPETLAHLASASQTCARHAGIALKKTDYHPHITLQRKIKHPVTALFEPHFTFHFDALHLFESRSTSTGVEYVIRASFPAPGDTALSARERLAKGLL